MDLICVSHCSGLNDITGSGARAHTKNQKLISNRTETNKIQKEES